MSLDYGSITAAIPYDGTVNLRSVVGAFASGVSISADGVAFASAGTLTDYRANFLYYQEKGETANGGPFAWLFETGDIKVGNGDTLWQVNSFVPDFAGLGGGGTLTAYARKYPQSVRTTTGPFSFTSASEKIDMMAAPPIGREIAFLFQGNSSPAFMRTGVLQMEASDTGMSF